MDNNTFILVSSLLALFFLIKIVKQISVNKLKRRLAECIINDEGEAAYMSVLDSGKTRMVLSAYYIDFLKMEYHMLARNKAQAIELYEKIISYPKPRFGDLITVHRQAIAFFVENDEPDMALDAFDKISGVLLFKKTKQNLALYQDLKLYIDVYVHKDVGRLDDCLALIEAADDSEAKAVHRFRAAKLYYYMGEIDKCSDMLELAAEQSTNKVFLEQVDRILAGRYEELE